MMEKLNMHAMRELRRCSGTSPFLQLGLQKKSEKKQTVIYQLLKQLPDILKYSCGAPEAAEKVIAFLEKEYEEGDFEFHALYEEQLKKSKQLFLRFIRWFYEQDYELVDVNVPFCVPFHDTYRGVEVTYIQDVVHLLLKNSECAYTAVRFWLGKIPYSHRAIKEENKVRNSIELSLMHLGLSKEYENLSVALWSLNSKEDKNILLEEYDAKGSTCQYSYLSGEAEESFKRSISKGEEENCKNCSYSSLCRMQEYRRGAVLIEPEKKTVPKTYSLTPKQEQVMLHKEGPLAVIAVPGSGKTFSLIRRLENLMLNEQVKPEEILFVTFTKKAADEIRGRVLEVMDGVKMENIHTFNSLGYSIIRENPELVHNVCKLAEKTDRYLLIEQSLKDAFDGGQISEAERDSLFKNYGSRLEGDFGLLRTLDTSFARLNEGREDGIAEEVKKLYTIYERLYKEAGYISYDEQVLIASRLLKENPDLLEKYQERYRYVMVDEFQDVSKEQCELVYQIAAHGNIVVVGDDDQSIYGWRGGSSRFILDFCKDWTGAKVIIMEDNFRSVTPILEASNELIQNNVERYSKNIIPHNMGGKKPLYYRNISTVALGNFVAGLIAKGVKAGNIAVLSRTNKKLEEINRTLEGMGIKTMRPRILVTEDAVFQMYWDLFYIFYGEGENDYSLYRLLTRLGCNFEDVEFAGKGSLMEKLVDTGYMIPIDLFNIECVEQYENHSADSIWMSAGYKIVRALKSIMYSSSLSDTLTEIFDILFGDEEQEHPMVEYLISKAEEKNISSIKGMYDYMKLMYRYDDTSEIEYPEIEDSVNMLTAHKSKGREYKIVIIYGVEDFDDTEEGRCLLYVAMTRAKQLLFMAEGISPRAVPLYNEIRDFITEV